tara:strand:- start:4203 stop:4718 length:516 start_codon:yes stop_codon:yes gene_type:complete
MIKLKILSEETTEKREEKIIAEACEDLKIGDLNKVKTLMAKLCKTISDEFDKIIKTIDDRESQSFRVVQRQAASERPNEPTEDEGHVIQRGDTLWDLAAIYLGNPRKWKQIQRYKANMGVAANPRKLRPGDRLDIPSPADGWEERLEKFEPKRRRRLQIRDRKAARRRGQQ